MAKDGRAKLSAGDPLKALAAATVHQAVIDCRRGDYTARQWLLTDGLIWLDGLGLDFDPDWLAGWVNAGCPDLRRRNRRVKS